MGRRGNNCGDTCTQRDVRAHLRYGHSHVKALSPTGAGRSGHRRTLIPSHRHWEDGELSGSREQPRAPRQRLRGRGAPPAAHPPPRRSGGGTAGILGTSGILGTRTPGILGTWTPGIFGTGLTPAFEGSRSPVPTRPAGIFLKAHRAWLVKTLLSDMSTRDFYGSSRRRLA